MTIKLFSQQTGIPASTLRYYETKNLLKPERGGVSGYRLYREEQVQTVKFIASLRKAGISIHDIRCYVQASDSEQENMKRKWRAALKEKRDQLDVSIRYLEASQTKEPFFLFEKSVEQVVWFEAEEPPGEFKEQMLQRRGALNQQVISIQNVYLQTIAATVSLVKAEIGFAIKKDVNQKYLSEGTLTIERASLCVGIPFRGHFSNVPSVYRKLYTYCMENNWIPTGPVYEWYRGDQLTGMDLVMPILQMEGEKDEK